MDVKLSRKQEWHPEAFSGKKVLAVFAHPDDGDFYFGGTVARLTAAGAEVNYLCATRGDKGDVAPGQDQQQAAAIREGEQLAAARVLGVKQVEFLGLADGRVVHDHDLIKAVVSAVRRQKPDLLLALDPSPFDPAWGVNHADHRAVALATMDAAYPYACNAHEFEDLEMESHRVGTLLVVSHERPNCFVDISGRAFQRKLAALAAHGSQWGANQAGPKAARQLGKRETFVRITWTH